MDQYPIAMMLMGYTIENIFRGIIITKMGLDDPQSKLLNVTNFVELLVPFKDGTTKPLMMHGLRRLLDTKALMNIRFDDPEKDMMDTLDMFIIWGGRYAAPKKSDPSDPFNLKLSEPIEYPYQVLDSIYQKSMEELIRVCMQQVDELSG